ncbi:MAG: glycoside hydrolase family 3 C-terminal domain-containing protein [Muribaculaceae bacterium]|nr:glycoside hydrolase family 3 C-terminal domain-containing protein [Muribaculaceae bacterium]
MAASAALYLNTAAPVEQRVDDLLSRMTLEEKIGQMNQCVGVEHFRNNMGALTEEDLKTNTANAFYPGMMPDDLLTWTEEGKIGSFLHVLTLEEANRLQQHAMKSRLGIPLIFGIDAIHGNANAPDNTVYPTNIGLACTFDTVLARRIAAETAREMRAMNMHWTFNPNVEVARDPRWGRCGETFGEDPWLVALMGRMQVQGYQGDFGPENVLACIKHFVGGSQSVNGTNGAPCDVSERTLRELFFPPFREGVKAGAGSLMTSHNEVNGYPAHTNSWLMTDVMRGEWDFAGFIVSDWDDIEHVHDLHHTAESDKEAFRQAIMAGMDMHMHGPEWNEAVLELVQEGAVPESRIDESVRRILEAKFRLGLFENPYADEARSMEIRLCDEHRATALDAARRSIVLLKNDGVLPLQRGKHRRILVTGINADDENILGDWSASQRPENVVTLLEGLREADPDCEFVFVDQGWDPRNMDPAAVDRAVAAAADADLIICAAGEYMMRHRWTERTCGEDTDRSDIALVGLQSELIRRLAATGRPLVTVLINGRPLGVEQEAELSNALIEAWEPGMTGGTALAEIIYGDVNPSGRLAITVPRSVGQVQMVYNHKPSAYFHPVAVTPSTPLYPFGYGLGYTTFSISNLRVLTPEVAAGEPARVEVDVTNTGERAGRETVQLYLRDEYSSATRPVKELCGFSLVDLEPGECKTVSFTVSPEAMSILDARHNPVIEPGRFIIMAGNSSADESLLKSSFNVK